MSAIRQAEPFSSNDHASYQFWRILFKRSRLVAFKPDAAKSLRYSTEGTRICSPARQREIVDVERKGVPIALRTSLLFVKDLLVGIECDEHADWAAGWNVAFIGAQVCEKVRNIPFTLEFSHESNENLMVSRRLIELGYVCLDDPATANVRGGIGHVRTSSGPRV
jgi:hypothetical protein